MKKYKATVVIQYPKNDEDEQKIEKKFETIIEGENPEEAMGNLWDKVDSQSIFNHKEYNYPDIYLYEITEDDEVKEA